MYAVQTDHQIIAFGADKNLMQLLDCGSGQILVQAHRDSDTWAITAEGITDVSAPTRVDAINAMIQHALQSLPGTGYSTMVPYGLADLP